MLKRNCFDCMYCRLVLSGGGECNYPAKKKERIVADFNNIRECEYYVEYDEEMPDD